MVDAAHARTTADERTLVLLDAAAYASTVRIRGSAAAAPARLLSSAAAASDDAKLGGGSCE